MWPLARVTCVEIFRDRLYLVSAFLALCLLGVAVLASFLTYATPERILLDFGISGTGLALNVLAILIGATMFPREVERRTLLVVLARPLSRPQFVVGKWLGLVMAIVMNAILLSLASAAMLTWKGGQVGQPQWVALGILVLQAVLMSSLALAGSIVFSRTFSMLLCVGLYLIGQNQTQIAKMAENVPVLKVVNWLLPNFEMYHLGWLPTYNLPVPYSFLWYALAYTVIYTAVVLGAGCWSLERKGI